MRHLTLFALQSTLISAALTINGKRCGGKICSLHEFCSSFHNQCESCENICRQQSHNFDEELCVKQCQDYLHDIRYIQSQILTDDILHIKKQQTVCLVLLIIILLLILGLCVFNITRWIKKKNGIPICFLKKIKPVKPTVGNGLGNETIIPIPNKVSEKETDAVDSNIFQVSDASTVHTVSTPIHNRYPAENSTTEYSYDNAALQVTPSTDVPKGTETTF